MRRDVLIAIVVVTLLVIGFIVQLLATAPRPDPEAQALAERRAAVRAQRKAERKAGSTPAAAGATRTQAADDVGGEADPEPAPRDTGAALDALLGGAGGDEGELTLPPPEPRPRYPASVDGVDAVFADHAQHIDDCMRMAGGGRLPTQPVDIAFELVPTASGAASRPDEVSAAGGGITPTAAAPCLASVLGSVDFAFEPRRVPVEHTWVPSAE